MWCCDVNNSRGNLKGIGIWGAWRGNFNIFLSVGKIWGEGKREEGEKRTQNIMTLERQT